MVTRVNWRRGLVWVGLQPSRLRLPVRQRGVVISNGHLDLRQTLSVEYSVLRDDLVEVEEKRRQRVHLVGLERSFLPEGDPAIDVIPHDGRQRCGDRQY